MKRVSIHVPDEIHAGLTAHPLGASEALSALLDDALESGAPKPAGEMQFERQKLRIVRKWAAQSRMNNPGPAELAAVQKKVTAAETRVREAARRLVKQAVGKATLCQPVPTMLAAP